MTTPNPITNPLDRAIWRLERTLRDRAEHPLRRLRKAIETARRKPTFDEQVVVRELDKIEARSYVAGEEIDNLAAKIAKEPPLLIDRLAAKDPP